MIGVFLDRDGTIGGHGGWTQPDEFELFENATSSIQKLNDAGKSTETEFISNYKKMLNKIRNQGATIDDIYYCPHGPQDSCDCRKPKPKLLLKAKKDHDLKLNNCYVVGDRASDIIAAENVNAKGVLVKTGRGERTLCDIRKKLTKLDIHYVANNIEDAVNWIKKENAK